jgi:hypothetical protein
MNTNNVMDWKHWNNRVGVNPNMKEAALEKFGDITYYEWLTKINETNDWEIVIVMDDHSLFIDLVNSFAPSIVIENCNKMNSNRDHMAFAKDWVFKNLIK